MRASSAIKVHLFYVLNIDMGTGWVEQVWEAATDKRFVPFMKLCRGIFETVEDGKRNYTSMTIQIYTQFALAGWRSGAYCSAPDDFRKRCSFCVGVLSFS